MIPKPHIYFHTPIPLFKARVNMPTVNYPVMELVYDGVTLGTFNDIQFDATLTLGTTEGGDDLGRVRVQKPLHTADTIYIARSSQGFEDGTLDIQDDAYITVWEDYRVWAKLPYFDLDAGIDYKDGDVPVGDNNTAIPPVSNAGPYCATYVDPGTLIATIQFPLDGMNNSFAMADGATIVSHSWNVGDGVITVGDATTAVITAEFGPGFRYVAYTVTDSNGKQHTSRTAVLTIDKNDDPTIKNFTVSQRLEITGQTLDVEIFDELPRETYPDGTLVLFWWGEEMDNPGSRSHMKFSGWVDGESSSVKRDKTGLKKSTKLHCVDITGRLDKLPGFPQALSRVEDESPWSYMPSLDMSKSLFYLLFWHSTAISLADFILPVDGGDYDAMRLDASGATLFQQVNSQANKLVPDHYLTCNTRGQMNFLRNWMLDDVADRPAVSHSITEGFWNDLSFDYNRHPKVHVLRSGAILSSTSFIEVDGEETLPLAFSVAPGGGSAFGQGTREQVESEGLALSQEALNKSEGHRYALLNSRYGELSFKDPSGTFFWIYEPAFLSRIEFVIGEDKAAQRGLDFTSAAGLIKEISINYKVSKEGRTVDATVRWEKEVEGYPALTFTPETGETTPYVPPVLVPEQSSDFNLRSGTQQLVLVGLNDEVYQTNNFQSSPPTWTQRFYTIVGTTHPSGAEPSAVRSWVVDPFSPGYRDVAGGAVNGWLVDHRSIWRVEDLHGIAPTAEAAFIFPDPPFPGFGSRRAIAASFGRFQEVESDNPWIVCVSYYDVNTADGTYDKATCVYSVNGGQTWSGEITINTNASTDPGPSDLGNSSDFHVGLWVSPRTPGLAYTALYTASGENPPTHGFITEDWGATWTQIVTPDIEPGQNFAGTIHVPWDDNANEELVYHTHYTRGTPHVYRTKRVTGALIEDVSPVVGANTYGIFRGNFGIQSYHTDRNRMLLCGVAGTNPGAPLYKAYALFTSLDGGDTWTLRLGPLDNYGDGIDYFLGHGGWEAAFAADDPNSFFLWGGTPAYDYDGTGDPYTYSPGSILIGYSNDFGATVQNKEGNLVTYFNNTNDLPYSAIGIAGGPLVSSNIPEATQPTWGIWNHAGTLTILGSGLSASVLASALDGGTADPLDEDSSQIVLAPPANTKRVRVSVTWQASKTMEPSASGFNNLSLLDPSGGFTRTDGHNFVGPGDNETTSGSYEVEWIKPSGDWTVNKDSIISNPPANPNGARVRTYANADAPFEGSYMHTKTSASVRIIEIELDDGTIYTDE